MKKILAFTLLVLLASMWSAVDARWVVGDRKAASEIKAGDTVVIRWASSQDHPNRYIQAADEKYSDLGVIVADGMGLGSSAIIAVEEGPADIRTGAPTVLLKLVETGKYIGRNYYDWTDKGQGVADLPENAANFQILSMGEQIPWSTGGQYDTWPADYQSRWDAQTVAFASSPSETGYCYLSHWANYSASAPRVITWGYTDSGQWDVFSASYVDDLSYDLENLINAYTEEAGNFIEGIDPGFMPADKLTAFNDALVNAMQVCYTPGSTKAELQSAIDQLKAAYTDVYDAQIPITEGYYYLVVDNHKISDGGYPEKAMYVNEDNKKMYWGIFDPDDIKFVFHLTPNDAKSWNVRNLKSGLYTGPCTGFCTSFTAIGDNSAPCTFNYYRGTGSAYIKCGGWTMCPHNNANGSSTGPDDIFAYNGETTGDANNQPHLEWTWTLRKITDPAILDRLIEQKAQSDRTAMLKEKAAEAAGIYDNLFVYNADLTNGLITKPDQFSFEHVRSQGVDFADDPAFLLDDNDTTFVQASGYMQLDINAAPQNKVTFAYTRRGASNKYPNSSVWGESERPATIEIYGANDLTGDGDWKYIKTISMGDLKDPIMKSVDLVDTYKYLRYTPTKNKSGGTYFTISGFQVYPATIDESHSQYYTAQGMQPVADALKAAIDKANGIVDANTTTEQDIAEFTEALAAVKALYADTTELHNMIVECRTLANNTTVGSAIGQVSEESHLNDFNAAINTAAQDGLRDVISKAELDAVIAALTTARATFMSHIKSFEVGKWYFVLNNDLTQDETKRNPALYATGTGNTSNIGVGKLNEDGSAAYTYDPYSMWTFVAGEDGTYSVQNMGTGFYLGGIVKDQNNLNISYTKTPYKVNFIGKDSYALVPQIDNNKLGLSATADGKVEYVAPAAETASSWKIVEINPAETEMIAIKDINMNTMDVVALPYNIDNISEFSGGEVRIYGIKKMTQDEEGTTTIEFYEKTSAAAGEPCWLVAGNPKSDSEEYELVLPFPTEVTDASGVENGIVGMLHSESIEEGDVYSTGSELVAATKTTNISAHTGAINPDYYEGEVEGVETALTLTVKGMRALPDGNKKFDTNGDGTVNSADAVAIFNFIESGDGDAAIMDVNGDGTVNSSDVVVIYNVISGADTASAAVKAQIKRYLSKMFLNK